MKTCSVCGCDRKHYAKGYCSKHYYQVKKYGHIKRTIYDPNEIIEYEDYAEIVLYDKYGSETARAIIDLDDVDKAKDIKWCMTHNGYVSNRHSKQLLHRLVMNCPDDMVIDHINHNRLDNRKSNLRVCTQHQNNINKSFMSNNTSGVIGVHWNKSNNKWRSRIKYNGRQIHLGYFNTKEEAIQARINAEIEYFGEYRNNDEDVI